MMKFASPTGKTWCLPHVPQKHLHALWQKAQSQHLAIANANTLADIICCPGGDFCSLANAKSIPVAEAVQRRFSDLQQLYDLGPIALKISGCMNACGHHHVGHIGILGVDKKGAEFYQISLGGDATEQASVGKIIGPSFRRDQVVQVIEQIVQVYVAQRHNGETFADCVRRLGVAPFKQSVYGKC